MTQKQISAAKFRQTQREVEQDLRDLNQVGHIPSGWLIADDPIEPAKTRVTMCLDTDMVRWFRKLGPRYQTRMNAILRMYYHGVVSGEIEISEPVVKEPHAMAEEKRKFEIYRQEMRAMMRERD
jgi:uncharacterized protein (DUF4415 family)